MRAKILLLPAGNAGEILCGYAERLLTEISAAFNHSFSLMRGKVPAAGSQDALPDSLLDACQECQAVFLADAGWQGAQALYDGLALPLRIRCFSVSPSLCDAQERPLRLAVGTVLSLDRDNVHLSAVSAFRYAQEQEVRLTHVAPAGEARANWDQAMQLQQICHPAVSAGTLAAPDAIARMITAPDQLGLVLCPPYAGAMITAAGDALCAHPAAVHDLAFDDEMGVYAPCLAPADAAGEPDPLSAAYAVAKLLRFSLSRGREAACLEAAVENVLAAGWRIRRQQDAGITAQGMVELICEQIAVAGELAFRDHLHP